MAAYILVQVDVHDAVRYEDYKRMVPPSLAKFQGKFVVRGGTVTTLEGDWNPKRLVVLEFPTRELAQAWWSSPEYAPAKALRQQTADSMMILVDGFQP